MDAMAGMESWRESLPKEIALISNNAGGSYLQPPPARINHLRAGNAISLPG